MLFQEVQSVREEESKSSNLNSQEDEMPPLIDSEEGVDEEIECKEADDAAISSHHLSIDAPAFEIVESEQVMLYN